MQNTYKPSVAIEKALELPIDWVIEQVAPSVGKNITFNLNANGSRQIVENGEVTSGYISSEGNFVHSPSEKNREGNTITVSKYYLCEIGGQEINAQEIANLLLSLHDQQHKEDEACDEAGRLSSSIISLCEFIGQEVKKADFIVNKMVPERGLTMISGLPGSHKTWFYLNLVGHIITGQPLHGQFNTKPVNCLICNIDDELPMLHERLKRLVNIGDLVSNAYVMKDYNLDITKESMVSALGHYIRQKNIGLVIFDTLRQIHNKDENSSQDMGQVMAILKKLGQDTDTAILVVHHDSKDSKMKDSVTAPSGSIVISGNCSYSFRLKYNSETKVISVSPGKAKLSEPISKLALRFEKANWPLFTVVDTGDGVSDQEIKDMVIGFYDKNPAPDLTQNAFVDQFANDNKIPKARVKSVFKSLIESGALELNDSTSGQFNRKIYKRAKI
jgi:hypothetical protein